MLGNQKRKEASTVETEIALGIESRIKGLKEQQEARISQLITFARLYGNSSLMGISGLTPSMMQSYADLHKERVTDAVVQSVVDTVVAQVGENKPRPYFLTSGGTHRQQRKAKRLNWFSEGVFYENKAYELGGDAQRDGEVFGDGCILVLGKRNKDGKKRVCMERILSAECWVDEDEGGNGHPLELHYETAVDREVLKAEYPDKKLIIERADMTMLNSRGGSKSKADMVTVRYSWRLKSAPDAKDGRFCVSIKEQLLEPLTPYEHEFFPIARFISMSRPRGYWSQGVCERLQGKQIELNTLLAAEQRARKMVGTFRVFLEDGSKIVKEHVNNQTAAIVTYRGTAPIFHTAEPYPAAFKDAKMEIKDYCYESEGVSRLAAAGVKPQGLNSGEAQRVYRDSSTLRMKTRERNNESAYMACAAISIAVAGDIAKDEGGKYTVEAPNGRSMREVSLTSEELRDDDWSHQCFPTSSLPKDPAGRLQTIQEYVQAGFMTPRQARRALDFPDLEAVESLANAAEDLIAMRLDAICDDGEKGYEPPEPTYDLQLAKEMVVEYLNRGMAQELEDAHLDLLRDWNAQLDMLIQAAMPPAPPPGMGPPQANPMPAPTSALVPNVPGGGMPAAI